MEVWRYVDMCQAADELERIKNQLEQERQLRAVTEACLMEDRVAWQQVSAVATETLQHCAVLGDGLSTMRWQCHIVDFMSRLIVCGVMATRVLMKTSSLSFAVKEMEKLLFRSVSASVPGTSNKLGEWVTEYAIFSLFSSAMEVVKEMKYGTKVA